MNLYALDLIRTAQILFCPVPSRPSQHSTPCNHPISPHPCLTNSTSLTAIHAFHSHLLHPPHLLSDFKPRPRLLPHLINSHPRRELRQRQPPVNPINLKNAQIRNNSTNASRAR